MLESVLNLKKKGQIAGEHILIGKQAAHSWVPDATV
jgi:hypothetical protein